MDTVFITAETSNTWLRAYDELYYNYPVVGDVDSTSGHIEK